MREEGQAQGGGRFGGCAVVGVLVAAALAVSFQHYRDTRSLPPAEFIATTQETSTLASLSVLETARQLADSEEIRPSNAAERADGPLPDSDQVARDSGPQAAADADVTKDPAATARADEPLEPLNPLASSLDVGHAPFALVAPRSVSELHELFEEVGYSLPEGGRWHALVPRIYLLGLPEDLSDLEAVNVRKRLFIRAVLPLILLSNEELRERRERLVELAERLAAGEALKRDEQAWLASLAMHYGIESTDMDELLLRVDEVPASLALAQAIVESGWGTSRFALEGNALFGQRTWELDDAMVPEANGAVRVRAFDDLMASVRSYMHNLNTHPAYEGFRAKRARFAKKGERPKGYALAAALSDYAEFEDYVDYLRQLIVSNELESLEEARLDSTRFARRRATQQQAQIR